MKYIIVLKREKNIKNITYTTNEYPQLREDDIQIKWKEDNTYNSFYDNDFIHLMLIK